MTKSNTSRVTSDILNLTIVTFLDVVVKKNFTWLPVDWCMFWVVTGNRYPPRGSNENTLFITSTGNVSVRRWVITLVTMPLLDFVTIHWIRWIQWNSFRKNSIVQLNSRPVRRIELYTKVCPVQFPISPKSETKNEHYRFLIMKLAQY